ncbi:MAG: hypothetical protein ACIAXF_11725, partial [Phycisphaerales bacterium JB063]
NGNRLYTAGVPDECIEWFFFDSSCPGSPNFIQRFALGFEVEIDWASQRVVGIQTVCRPDTDPAYPQDEDSGVFAWAGDIAIGASASNQSDCTPVYLTMLSLTNITVPAATGGTATVDYA